MLYQDTVKETGRGEGGYRQMGGGEKKEGTDWCKKDVYWKEWETGEGNR